MDMPDETLNGDSIEVIEGMVTGAFTNTIRKTAINDLKNSFEEQGHTKATARETVAYTKTAINEFIDNLQPTVYKKRLLQAVFNTFYEIFDEAVEQYHNYAIDLQMMLEKDAKAPTYAHETDACADLYAQTGGTIPAHTMGTMIPTGVHIALPEGWVAMIFPRSSIGMKTPLRLSNSVGIIDSDYRGQLGVLYDNVSDSDVTINAGDRIAQMLVMPSYRFNAKVVDILPSTERGDGGFGSTGK